MAAHPVRNQDKPQVAVDLDGILILRADTSNIGAAG
jgi:hypothetical protein